MTAKKKTSKIGPVKNDGKSKQDLATRAQKMTAKKDGPSKYTLWQSKDDIAKINKVRKHLEQRYPNKSYRAKSKIYQDLPELYLNAVKKIDDQQLAIDELTAKLDQLDELRASFCRIMEICRVGSE